MQVADLADSRRRAAQDALPPGGAAEIGAELRQAREALGWTVPALAESLRIRRVYLEAIEGGRMGDLPGTTYALGFVRTYANALGLQGEAVAQRFRAGAGEGNRRPELSFPAPVPQRGVPAGAVILLGLVVAAGAYVGWYKFTESRHTPAQTVPPIPDRLATSPGPAPSPQVASILPSTSPPAPRPPGGVGGGTMVPAPTGAGPTVAGPTSGGPAAQMAKTAPPAALGAVPAAGVPATVPAAPPATGVAATPTPPPAGTVPQTTHILLKFTADSWITVKQKAGPPLISKLMHAGDTFPVPDDKTGLTLTTGNAGGTEIDVDGTPVPGLGGSGMVRRNLPLEVDLLKSGHLPPLRAPVVQAAEPQ